ncbi:hypothetical protein [Actinomycetospora cinnamomea]|uniref:Uncharacterized protein n=1 Tax=Actinomycetospora cinnamomea TaxID=663609 RepID=A0A2U1FD31_9PSEU|nr:hypothetical protein [Actinomycetospora cinnamomea]PVZ10097.1 hypothetical protein C8D89_105173 [Actinomycetospora cinnamomea]
MRTTLDTPARPTNRAERRAAARGKSATIGGVPAARAPRRTGPPEHTKPVHARTDFVARRGG